MAKLDLPIIPQHVAIIMDGNGRWAKQRGLPRTIGHNKGVEAVRQAVRAAGECGVKYLTLFAFSSENWSRPEAEIEDLLGLLRRFIRRDLADLHRENIRIRIIGERQKLRSDILPLLLEAEETTRNNTAMTLIIAFNYGARDEITRAAIRLVKDVQAGIVEPQDITPDAIGSRLDTAGIPDPDLGEEIFAFVKLRDGAGVGEDELKQFCRANFSRQKMPRYVRAIDALPMTANGKVQKFALREMAGRIVTEETDNA